MNGESEEGKSVLAARHDDDDDDDDDDDEMSTNCQLIRGCSASCFIQMERHC